MKIAYISYEHPEGISGGGIGTYIGQISKLMAGRGHKVEVFSGTLDSAGQKELDGYILNLIPSVDTKEFREAVVSCFEKRHQINTFDIIESPEYGADALEIKKKYPHLPLTLKLHTPTFLITKLNQNKIRIKDKLRFIGGGLIRGKIVKGYWKYRINDDPEYQLFKLANTVSSPSSSLSKIISTKWNKGKQISVIPNPFIINDTFLKIKSIENITSRITITFIGKLEKRKGVLDLMNAIPEILKKFPDSRFRFVGKALPSPDPGLNMMSFINNKLDSFRDALEFLGLQEYEKIPRIIEETQICIFPSLWENFPNVCLEAMAGGRVVIGTNNGGMADMIENDKNGILIVPGSPNAIVQAINGLISRPDKINSIGKAARKRVFEEYNEDLIGQMTEDFYKKTITR